MSFITKEIYGWVVTCDVCQSVGALCERDWREMRHGPDDQPIHLCRACQRTAVWCEHHGSYHRPDENHRRPCASCGGLFTAKVAASIEHCPSCRRLVPEVQRPPVRASSWLRLPNRWFQRLHLR